MRRHIKLQGSTFCRIKESLRLRFGVFFGQGRCEKCTFLCFHPVCMFVATVYILGNHRTDLQLMLKPHLLLQIWLYTNFMLYNGNHFLFPVGDVQAVENISMFFCEESMP